MAQWPTSANEATVARGEQKGTLAEVAPVSPVSRQAAS
jgi:hypothetical protein